MRSGLAGGEYGGDARAVGDDGDDGEWQPGGGNQSGLPPADGPVGGWKADQEAAAAAKVRTTAATAKGGREGGAIEGAGGAAQGAGGAEGGIQGRGGGRVTTVPPVPPVGRRQSI